MDALAWCKDRILVPGNPLTASLPFADEAERDSILALRTLVGELGASIEASDVQVGTTKLNWWRDALSGAQPAAQRHPVVQALNDSGAMPGLNLSSVEALIGALSELFDKPRFERFEDVWNLCERIGGQAALLEAELLGAQERDPGKNQSSFAQLRELGSAAYLIRMTRDIALDARANRWWVSLDFQADYQVSRVDVAEATPSHGFDGLVRSLIHQAIRRAQLAIRQISNGAAWHHRHLLIHWSLDQRLGLKVARRPSRILDRRILPSHAGNVWTAWRSARRLRSAL